MYNITAYHDGRLFLCEHECNKRLVFCRCLGFGCPCSVYIGKIGTSLVHQIKDFSLSFIQCRSNESAYLQSRFFLEAGAVNGRRPPRRRHPPAGTCTDPKGGGDNELDIRRETSFSPGERKGSGAPRPLQRYDEGTLAKPKREPGLELPTPAEAGAAIVQLKVYLVRGTQRESFSGRNGVDGLAPSHGPKIHLRRTWRKIEVSARRPTNPVLSRYHFQMRKHEG